MGKDTHYLHSSIANVVGVTTCVSVVNRIQPRSLSIRSCVVASR